MTVAGNKRSRLDDHLANLNNLRSPKQRWSEWIAIFVHSMSSPVTPYRHETLSKKEQVALMFNKIAGTYDFLNHFLSLGIDIIWRKRAIAQLKKENPKLILDVATGTGDFAFEALKQIPGAKITGVDISEGMLDIARQKIGKRKMQNRFSVEKGDSEKLLFEDNSFDAVTVSFGVRNFENLEQGMADINRVLKKGGKVVVLEFSKPRKFPIKQLYNGYFFFILPLIGKLFSKDKQAYTYLPESVAAFPDGEDFLAVLAKTGFSDLKWQSLDVGICAIYTGYKV